MKLQLGGLLQNEFVEVKKCSLQQDKDIINIKVRKHLGIDGMDVLDQMIEEKKKVLLIAPMKCGKSTFSFKQLYEVSLAFEFQMIFVSPKLSLIEQITSRYKVLNCSGGAGVKVNGLAVVTTPDSLYKVISSCEENNKKFFLVYDEVHEMELNYIHRKKLLNPLKFFEHNLCCGFLGLTATADNIIHSIDWDYIYNVDVQEKFQQSERTNIICGLGDTLEAQATHILKTFTLHKHPVVARINDKKRLMEIKDLLTAKGIKNVHVWYRDNKDEIDQELYYAMLEGIKADFDVLLTTSLVDVGVEIVPFRKPIVIDFINHNSRLIENIQFLGRFREGVAGYDIVLATYKDVNDELQEQFQEYKDIKLSLNRDVEQLCDIYNKIYPNEIMRNDLLQVEVNEFNEVKYRVDKTAVNSRVFKLYIQQVLKDQEILKRYLEEHKTFNGGAVKIIFVKKDDYLDDEKLKENIEELKEEKKAQKEEFKNEVVEFMHEVENMTEEQCQILVTKRDEVLVVETHILKSIEEQHEFYHSEDMKPYRKAFYSSLDLWRKKESYKNILLLTLNDERYKEHIKNLEYVKANNLYENYKEKGKDNKLIKYVKQVFAIRNALRKLKGGEKGVRLSVKLKAELLEVVRQEKGLSKMTVKALDKHMYYIYNFKDKNIISSINIKIKF